MKPIKVLSRRERQVVDLLLQGRSNKQIALSLGVSERTVEFHLRNVYVKLEVSSRVEVILKLGKATGGIFANLVESTVDIGDENVDNGSQPVGQQRWAQSLRNTISLIKQEIAMTARITFEDFGNYLRSHPVLFSLLLFLTVSLTTRYIVFDLGLYFWLSYVWLGLLLGTGSIYFGISWKKVTTGNFRFHPLVIIAVIALLPLIAAGFDQIYINTVLRYTEPISTTIGNISTQAMWRVAPWGEPYLYTERHAFGPDALWLLANTVMLILFLLSLAAGKRFNNNDLKTA
ncbi:MAG: helix-turn-helix transcriptional regulator [Chloroflexi bacterium]|nr:helix-turn-helix transcriptional regulator [Chloroflexota bacterium]